MASYVSSYSFHLVQRDDADNMLRLAVNGVFRRSPSIEIPEDVFWYVVELLDLIPTESGSFANAPWQPPVVGVEGARIASRVFNALANICHDGPDPLQFTNNYHRTSVWDRAKVVLIFRRLAEFAEMALKGNHLIYWSTLMDYGTDNVSG